MIKRAAAINDFTISGLLSSMHILVSFGNRHSESYNIFFSLLGYLNS